jgi:phage terminase large subunit-like protein
MWGTLPNWSGSSACFRPAGYVGPRSPDHADAVIWGLTELMLGPPVGENLFEYYGGILAESRV